MTATNSVNKLNNLVEDFDITQLSNTTIEGLNAITEKRKIDVEVLIVEILTEYIEKHKY